MKLLEERIVKDGIALNENVLKVDCFLNHQVDPELMQQIGLAFANHFKDRNITKVVTIESSDIWQTPVVSFTKGTQYDLTLSKKYLSDKDTVLVIDDFLANGEAASAACRLVDMAQAKVAGIGIVIEKSFQPGRKKLDDLGFEVFSLARIAKLSPNKIEFIEE